MLNNKFSFVSSFALIALFLPAPAQASTLTFNSTGYGSAVSIVAGGNTFNVFAGQLNVTVDGVNMIAFCVDFFSVISRTTYLNTQDTPANFANGGRAAWIVETYGQGIATASQAAAMQLALWDVVHDQGNGLGAGSFALTSGSSSILRTAADAIVQASIGHSSDHATILRNTNSATGYKAQTLITATGSEVPEPSTFAMLGLGGALCCMVLVRKR